MAQHRRSPTAPHPTTTARPNRKYRLRNSPVSRTRSAKTLESSGSPSSSHKVVDRPVLVPLHPNLRRLPSRSIPSSYDTEMAPLRAGTKRKRVASTNENALSGARGRSKRRRGYNEDVKPPESEMDIDEAAWFTESEHGDDETSDQYFLAQATSTQLLRLRKEELWRLFELVNDTQCTQEMTKIDIVDAIIAARDEEDDDGPNFVSSPLAGPPSSSPSSAGNLDEDEGEFDEEVAPLPSTVAKSAGFNLKSMGRSFSLNWLANKRGKDEPRNVQRPALTPRQQTDTARNLRSSSTRSRNVRQAASSPLITRLRTRTVSFLTSDGQTPGPPMKRKDKCDIHVDENGMLRSRNRNAPSLAISPRRLRARSGSHDDMGRRRVTPMRKAKGRVGSLQESDEEEEEEDELADDDIAASAAEVEDPSQGDELQPSDEDEDQQITDIDELESSASLSQSGSIKVRSVRSRGALRRTQTAPDATPKPTRRTGLRRAQTYETPPSDGDDEEEAEDEEDSVDGEVEEAVEMEVEPKRLRNGKIVGEESENDAQEEEGKESVDEEGDEESVDDATSIDLEAQSEGSSSIAETSASEADDDADAEGEEDETDYVGDDLQDATTKTLVRMKRDVLVQLCEARGIEATGTKPQLAEALIIWRDSQTISSAPASDATARPSSTQRPDHHKHAATPVLLRSCRVHEEQPETPRPLSNELVAPADDGVLLDLEDLGLEDSVIPPSKLTKLDKIGSGGFKDVFIGKLAGRKVAIAEFRGQLTEMDIKELKLLSRFSHPNVVRFMGVSIPENPKETPMIVSELCSNGDLFDYVRNVDAPPLFKVLSLMLDVAHGLQYLHDHKPSVIHRDCKSSNILITSRVTAKITDFGLAKVKQSTRSMVRSLVGTVNWQAPELWHAHPKYNFKVDVFSCAMVFWEMLQWHSSQKKFPWEGMNEHAIYEQVGAKQQRPSVSGLRKLWCPEIIELIETMWAHDPKDRPDMARVVTELETLKQQYRKGH